MRSMPILNVFDTEKRILNTHFGFLFFLSFNFGRSFARSLALRCFEMRTCDEQLRVSVYVCVYERVDRRVLYENWPKSGLSYREIFPFCSNK